MKKQFFVLLATLLFVFALTACGSDQKQDSQSSQAQNNAGDAITGTDNADRNDSAIMGSGSQNGSSAGGSADSTNDTIGEMLFGENNASDSTAKSRTAGSMGTNYDQMLRNARVHDTDGDLSDLENDYTPGSLGW